MHDAYSTVKFDNEGSTGSGVAESGLTNVSLVHGEEKSRFVVLPRTIRRTHTVRRLKGRVSFSGRLPNSSGYRRRGKEGKGVMWGGVR